MQRSAARLGLAITQQRRPRPPLSVAHPSSHKFRSAVDEGFARAQHVTISQPSGSAGIQASRKLEQSRSSGKKVMALPEMPPPPDEYKTVTRVGRELPSCCPCEPACNPWAHVPSSTATTGAAG